MPVDALRNLIKTLTADQRGNFAIMTAVSLMGIVMIVGGAVDYSRVASSITNYQQAADAAVLAASKKRNEMTNTEMTEYARKIFDANIAERAGAITDFSLEMNEADHRLTLNTKGRLKTAFIGIMGFDNLNFDVLSQVGLPGSGLEVALVLDNTDSMDNDGKIGALKLAATNFLNLLMPGETNSEESLKIGIVPFGNYVNVGIENRNKNWIDVPDDYSEERTYRPVTASYNCRMESYSYTYEGRTYSGEREVCDHDYGPEETYTQNYTWSGCVGSRKFPLNIRDKKYNSDKVLGLLNLSCTSKVLPLTHMKNLLQAKISGLTTYGQTYIPAGIVWGQRVLSKKAPFTEGSSKRDIADEKVKQVLVLMTDGQNTKSKSTSSGRDGAYHWSGNLQEANSWTAKACKYAKNQNIEIYTVTFGPDLDNPTKLLMAKCASSPDHYFDAASGAALDMSFQNIANSIRTVYLSK